MSKNKFSDETPPGMSGFNFLAYLDLSNNFGEEYHQALNYKDSIFPYMRGTQDSVVNNEIDFDREDSDKRWLYVSASLGFRIHFGASLVI